MRRCASIFVLILTFALLFCSPCSALSPTPTPSRPPMMPTPAPTWPDRDSCGNHIRFSVSGLGSEPKKHLIYSHENGIMADGFLMFMPLGKYVKGEEIPVISRRQFQTSKLSYDTYVSSFSCKTDFYLKTEDGIVSVGDQTTDLSDLPEGTYLVRMDCSAAHKGVAYRFCYLFWVK